MQQYNQEKEEEKEAFAEFDLAPEPVTPFSFPSLNIWQEHLGAIELFNYAVFKFNNYNGFIQDVDWVAVDVLLRRLDVQTDKKDFNNWRIALQGYIDVVNAHLAEQLESDER